MYGAALLCKAQEDRDVFGAPVADASAARDRGGAAAKTAAAGPSCAPGDKGKGKAPAAPADEAADSEEEGDEGDDEEDEEGEEGEEDASDLQLSWENLEYARLIYSGGPDGGAVAPEHREALAQVHVKLGQVSSEEEQFESALAEFDKALSLFREITPPPHRRIAGLLYDMALALQQLQRPDEALARVGNAIAACQRRLTELRMAAPAGSADTGAADEVSELGARIEELRMCEEELRISAADAARTKDALKAAFASMAGAASGAAAFDAPKMAAAAPAADLGVVGRGVARITPTAAGGASASGAAGTTVVKPTETTVRRVTPQAQADAPPAAPKRTLEDALGGGAGASEAVKEPKPAAEGECKQQ